MTDWWRERRQNEQLEDLQSEMSYARQETSRLQSQLSKIQGGLQERVNRLSTAFDAFVELSDLRYEMSGYLPAAELRRYTSQVLTAMASDTPLPPPTEPVPQYWLGPATEALITLASAQDVQAPGPGQDEQALGVAMGLDGRRTATFLSLALAALGQRHQVRSEWLDVAFGVLPADGTVTRVQRVLWATAARGGFGADGLELVVKRLQSAAPPADWLPKLEKRGETPPSSGTRFEAVAEQVTARIRLGRVRSAVESIAGNTEAREPAPTVKYDSAGSTAAVLRLLISEGSEPERESLARVAVLRAQISGAGESAAEGLEDSVGTVEGLLADDLGQKDDPHLAATVLRVIGPSVLPSIEELARVAGQPSPAQIDVASDGHTIAVRPDGPDQLQLSTAVSTITRSAGVVSTGKYAVPTALVGIGVVVAIALGLVNAIWIVAGAILIGIGAFRYWNLRTTSKADQAAAAERATRLTERCTTATTQLADYTNSSDARQSSVATDLTTIRTHLTT
ncbi:hypothetical protein [Kribbella sp. NPDC000426]|uniref:hypothetical protein n=1 Tax=Kribbella sp. NPDC000426 TaxID=3154255 RepID=UPI003319600B